MGYMVSVTRKTGIAASTDHQIRAAMSRSPTSTQPPAARVSIPLALRPIGEVCHGTRPSRAISSSAPASAVSATPRWRCERPTKKHVMRHSGNSPWLAGCLRCGVGFADEVGGADNRELRAEGQREGEQAPGRERLFDWADPARGKQAWAARLRRARPPGSVALLPGRCRGPPVRALRVRRGRVVGVRGLGRRRVGRGIRSRRCVRSGSVRGR